MQACWWVVPVRLIETAVYVVVVFVDYESSDLVYRLTVTPVAKLELKLQHNPTPMLITALFKTNPRDAFRDQSPNTVPFAGYGFLLVV